MLLIQLMYCEKVSMILICLNAKPILTCFAFPSDSRYKISRKSLSAEDWFRLRQSIINVLEMFLNTLNAITVTDDCHVQIKSLVSITFKISMNTSKYLFAVLVIVQCNYSCRKFHMEHIRLITLVINMRFKSWTYFKDLN